MNKIYKLKKEHLNTDLSKYGYLNDIIEVTWSKDMYGETIFIHTDSGYVYAADYHGINNVGVGYEKELKDLIDDGLLELVEQ